ncbi:STM4012 family radical SAM protein [Lachnoclostridium edouardi]|uniref:STM4012 family radical SAM protein n=1 Tax=Lachnoclostridium edouardi TaxID=1926283 RepID=UPI002F418EFD
MEQIPEEIFAAGKEKRREQKVFMDQVVGKQDILFVCLDTLRFDAALEEERLGGTPVLNQYGPWKKCQAAGNFTYPSHQAMFAGFLPCDWDAKSMMDRDMLFFPKNIGMGRQTPPGAFAFEGPTFIQGLEKEGYETYCIGGVAFFDKRSDIGKVLPSYFMHSYWNPSFGCGVKDSAKNQIDFAIKKLGQAPEEKRVFMYINIDAIHYPNYFYAEGEKHDSLVSHRAALRYVDKELKRLFEAFERRSSTFVICCSDHGSCYGEDGVVFHGINHPVVNTVPYKHFFLPARPHKDGSVKEGAKINYYTQYMYSYPHKTAYRPLENVRFEDYCHRLMGKDNSLYIHIPFCETKCGYCNLFSVSGALESLGDQYLDAVERQVQGYKASRFSFQDFTVGGGTPLIFTESQLERMFTIGEEAGAYKKNMEKPWQVIVETSPNQTSPEKLAVLKKYGTTRVSMGVQSFFSSELQALNRRHSPEQARKAAKWIREAGFSCLNLDLIYGIPGQTEKSFLASIDEALYWRPEEIFLYPLYIKEGTYLAGQKVKHPENTMELYKRGRAYLREKGYVPCSMRRFVRGDYMKEEILSSCGFGNTLSLGCGGRSYLGNLHFCTPYGVSARGCRNILEKFIKEQDYGAITNGIFLSPQEEKRRFVIKNLLFFRGICLEEYYGLYKKTPEEDFEILNSWVKAGYVKRSGGYLGLTEEGFCLSDYLGPMLQSEDVTAKMAAWKETDL